MSHRKITLLIDADDTLWDNNIYFEAAIKDFITMMEERGHSKEELEPKLRAHEMENVKHYGYGSYSFKMSMYEVYIELCSEAGIEPEQKVLDFIEHAKDRTCNYPINLLPGVIETLPILAGHFRLIICTKGVHEEQMRKIERSGVAHFFEKSYVLPEKEEKAYKQLLDDIGAIPSETWMIGNSPRSDINPAKAIGMRTAMIPYHATWAYEITQIDEGGHETMMCESFWELEKLVMEYGLNAHKAVVCEDYIDGKFAGEHL